MRRKHYRYFILCNDTGDQIELRQAPVGWDNQKYNVIRDLVYLGVIKTISVEFDFVGDGFTFLQNRRLRFGPDFNCILRIYEYNKWLFDGKINTENFSEFRKDKKFRVDIIQSGFVQKFHNREDVQLNILNNIGLDGQAVAPATLKAATIRGKKILYESTFTKPPTESEPEHYHHTLPFLVVKNGNPNIDLTNASQFDCNPVSVDQAPDFPDLQQADELMAKSCSIFVNRLPATQSITVEWGANFTIALGTVNSDFSTQGTDFRNPGFGTWGHTVEGGFFSAICKISLRLLDENNEIVDVIYENLINSYEGGDPVINPDFFGVHELQGSHSIDVPPGYSLVFTNEQMTGHNDGSGLIDGPFQQDALMMSEDFFIMNYTYNELSLVITEDSVVDESEASVILPHELFQNLVSQINAGEFYSEVFGRVDLGYDYDGEFAYLAITTGKILRGIPLEGLQIPMSFRDAFRSYSSVICLGAVIEGNRIRVDPLDMLFTSEIVADLGEVDDLSINPLKEFWFNAVKAGYPKNEYEQENGLDEFNTIVQYTNSFQAIKKELDLTSIFFGDGTGIEFARRASIVSTGSADSRYDDIIFFIDMILVEDEDYPDALQSRRLEGIDFVDGIFSPETAINLRIYTGQNMLRWRKYLNIPLYKKDHLYFFQTKQKNSNLKIITELGTSNDGENLQTGLTTLFLPEDRQFNCPLTIDTMLAIINNPLGRFAYTYKEEKFFDFLFELDTETERHKGQWRMIGTKPSPVEVNEDALTGPYIKYGTGPQELALYDEGENSIMKYDD